MKSIKTVPLLIVAIFFLVLLIQNRSVFVSKTNPQPTPKSLTSIRVGWQIPWAVQGQLAQVLKHTEVLKEQGLEADFKGFSFGAPLNEAAIAGQVDVIFTADQPAATLINKNSDWKIIGRLMYNRVTVYTPPNSDIKEIKDLKGKTVAMPFGAAAQRHALKIEKDAGLNPSIDVNNINLGIYEQSDLVKDIEAVKWGDIDAMAGFDPTPAIFEEKGLVNVLSTGKVVSLIVMSDAYIKKNPKAPSLFLKSFKNAYTYYKNNVDQVNEWFVQESKLQISPKALEISAQLEPNLNKENEVRIDFTEDDYTIMQEAADFLLEQKLINNKVDMRKSVDMSYLAEST